VREPLAVFRQQLDVSHGSKAQATH